MLIKEFKIPMPMEVEEYRIAQLYSIQKFSKENSSSCDDGILFIKNEPYTNGFGGSGQYTKKIYYLYHKAPSWLQFLIPKNFASIEDAWNAYPHSKTIYTFKLFPKARIEIETHFLPDNGSNDNVFPWDELKKEGTVLSSQLIDICDDKLASKPFNSSNEDPKIFVSSKTNRGPLNDDWIKTNPEIMCSHKLIKISFPYWGFQVILLISQLYDIHRSVWIWQDEWHGLNIEQIREIEHKAKLELENIVVANDDDILN